MGEWLGSGNEGVERIVSNRTPLPLAILFRAVVPLPYEQGRSSSYSELSCRPLCKQDYLHSPSVHRGRGPPPQTTCGRVVRELDMKELKKGVVSKMFSLGMKCAQPWVKVGLTMG